jgi:hypothetical protein
MTNFLKKIKPLVLLLILGHLSFVDSQTKISIEGLVYDEYDYPVPYSSIGILKKNIGASSTEEGSFSFFISQRELMDTLDISSIGYESFKISVKEFLKLSDKKIVLKEKITELGEVSVQGSKDIVKKALKNLKSNTLYTKHKLGVLYRRWSVEDNICRFFIEQYIDIIDRGPYSAIHGFKIRQNRTSSDYRFVKNMQDRHAVQYMEWNNPLRKGIALGIYKWKKIKDTNYENEDVVVIKGTDKKGDHITLYIGFNNSKIYRVDKLKTPKDGKGGQIDAIYIYKNNSENKLYLTYHKREWKTSIRTPEHIRKIRIQAGKEIKPYIPLAYRHEAFVLNLEVNPKVYNAIGDETNQRDMTLYKLDYNQNFWNNLSLPPETKFYQKNIGELESLFEVPIETQFKYSNSN